MPVFRPQKGPQEHFLASTADIVIYGGGAGGGKSYALLLEAMRKVRTPGYGGVIFRRTRPEITNQGGLWDESQGIYPFFGGFQRQQSLEWLWPKSRARVRFSHLQYEKDLLSWHGAQVPFIGFDELTTFTRKQFFYMLSRNRSATGIKPYIRATCNPNADSWVAEFIAWWINQETGYPIPERNGVIRYFVRGQNDEVIWADDPRELYKHLPDPATLPDSVDMESLKPKSVTFIQSKVFDNPALLSKDPTYLANLLSLDLVERERLLGGNWKIRPAAGLYFQRSWVMLVDDLPAGLSYKRGWDIAATPKTETNDPDWTAGCKLGRDPAGGLFYIADHVRDRLDPHGVERLIVGTASHDGLACSISLPQDPGASGKAYGQSLITALAGYDATMTPESGDKTVRFRAFSAQARAGNVRALRAPWNDVLFTALEGFPEAAHDDDADAVSRAFTAFQATEDGFIDYYRAEAEQMIAEQLKARESAAGAGVTRSASPWQEQPERIE